MSSVSKKKNHKHKDHNLSQVSNSQNLRDSGLFKNQYLLQIQNLPHVNNINIGSSTSHRKQPSQQGRPSKKKILPHSKPTQHAPQKQKQNKPTNYSSLSKILQQKNILISCQQKQIQCLKSSLDKSKKDLELTRVQFERKKLEDLAALKKREKDNQGNIKELEVLRVGVRQMKARVQSLELERDMYQRKCNQYLKDNEELTIKMTSLKQQFSSRVPSQKTLQQLQSQVKDLQHFQKHTLQLQTQKHILEQRSRNLQKKLNQYIVKHNDLQSEHNQSQIKYYRAQKENDDLRLSVEELQVENRGVKKMLEEEKRMYGQAVEKWRGRIGRLEQRERDGWGVSGGGETGEVEHRIGRLEESGLDRIIQEKNTQINSLHTRISQLCGQLQQYKKQANLSFMPQCQSPSIITKIQVQNLQKLLQTTTQHHTLQLTSLSSQLQQKTTQILYLQSELSTLKHSLQQSTLKSHREMEEHFKEHDSRIRDYEQQLREARAKVEELNVVVWERNQFVESLEARNSQLREELNSVKELLEDINRECGVLKVVQLDRKAMEVEIRQLKELRTKQIQYYQNKIRQLTQRQLDSLQSQKSQYQKMLLQSTQTSNKSLQSQKSHYQQLLLQTSQKSTQSLQQLSHTHQQSLSVQQTTISTLNQQLHENQTQINKCQTKITELNGEIIYLESQVKYKTVQIEEKDRMVQMLRERVEECENRLRQIEGLCGALERERDGSVEAIQCLRKEKVQLQNILLQVQRQCSQQKESLQSLPILQHQLTHLQNQVHQHQLQSQQHHQQYLNLQLELQHQQSKFRQLESVNQELQHQISHKNTVISLQEKNIGSVNAELREIRLVVQEYRDKVDRYNRMLEEADRMVESQMYVNKESEYKFAQQLTYYKYKYEQTYAQYQKTVKTLQTLQSQHIKQTHLLLTAQHNIQQLQPQLQQAKKQNKQLQTNLYNLNRQYQQYQQKHGADMAMLEVERNQFKEEMLKVQLIVSEVMGRLGMLEQQKKSLRQEVKGLVAETQAIKDRKDGEFAELLNKYKNVHETLTTQQQQSVVLKQQLSQSQTQLSTLSQQLAQSQTQLAALHHQLSQSQSELTSQSQALTQNKHLIQQNIAVLQQNRQYICNREKQIKMKENAYGEEMEKIKAQNRKLMEENQRVFREGEMWKGEAGRIGAEVEGLRAAVLRLERELADLTSVRLKNQDMSKQLIKLRTQNTQYHQQISSLTTQIQQLEQQLQSVSQKQQTQQTQLTLWLQKCETLQKQHKKIQNQLTKQSRTHLHQSSRKNKEAERQIQSLKTQIRLMQDQNSNLQGIMDRELDKRKAIIEQLIFEKKCLYEQIGGVH